MWPERADVVHVTTEGPKALKVAGKVRKLLAKQSIETIATKLNKSQPQVSFMRKRYLKDDLMKEGLTWEQNWMSPLEANAENGSQKFSMVAALLPPEPKALDEARGFVIADYQDHLEKEWVEDLRLRYPVKVNNDVLNTLIRE
jgi:peptidyl-prolyl cis-trans isomerase SurA